MTKNVDERVLNVLNIASNKEFQTNAKIHIKKCSWKKSWIKKVSRNKHKTNLRRNM